MRRSRYFSHEEHEDTKRPRGTSSCLRVNNRSAGCAWNDVGGCARRTRRLTAAARQGGDHGQAHRSRRAPLLSSGPASGVRATRARRASSAGCGASRAARSSCSRSSAATIPARAARGRDFKRCCLTSGRFRRRGEAGLLAVVDGWRSPETIRADARPSIGPQLLLGLLTPYGRSLRKSSSR